MLWGGVGREAGTSTVLVVWFRPTSPSPLVFIPFTVIKYILLVYLFFNLWPTTFHPCPQICGNTGSSHRQIDPRLHHAMIPSLTFVWCHIVPAQLICCGEAIQWFLPGNWWGSGWQRCWRCGGVTEVVLLEGQRYIFSVQTTMKTSSSRIAVVPCI